jgi:hypothetical protein
MKVEFLPFTGRAPRRDQVDVANAILEEYDAQGFVLTVRQLYYQFVARDLLANTDRNYRWLGKLVLDAREGGLIDWDLIEDRGRNLDAPSTWSSPGAIVQGAAEQYRRDKWAEQTRRVECWVEKDALLGVIERACEPLEVPFMSCRGYPSISMLYGSAQRDIGLILHLGDHDPSGVDASRAIADKLALYGSPAEVRRIALTWDQAQELAQSPNKVKWSDTRAAVYAAQYGKDCWELDALEPQVIVDLITNEVLDEIDQDAWDAEVEREGVERDLILAAAQGLDGTSI